MESVDLELAAEFCKLVGAPNLLVYLGLDEDADPGDAAGRLKARRKFMQGMQGNPKYKREALFLIKNFSALNEVLADLPTYLRDAQHRSESEHLPVVEMTVRGVLAGGAVTEDQIAYLRRNAAELGVTEVTFREVLARLSAELGTPLDPALLGRTGLSTGRDDSLDLYELLGVPGAASEADISAAFDRRVAEVATIADPVVREAVRHRLEMARDTLADDANRRQYDATTAHTGPPARVRSFSPPGTAATAPPVRERTVGPGPRLEILGEPVRTLRLGSGITVATIGIRNGGTGAMAGTVAADVSWVVVDPTRLDPDSVEQVISVQVDRSDVPENATTASVTIHTERGERARVVFEIRRGLPLWAVAAIGVTTLVGVLLAMWVVLSRL
ncbi:MAG: hypothetical protein ABMB14_16035 [Myxococcota bacterium]